MDTELKFKHIMKLMDIKSKFRHMYNASPDLESKYRPRIKVRTQNQSSGKESKSRHSDRYPYRSTCWWLWLQLFLVSSVVTFHRESCEFTESPLPTQIIDIHIQVKIAELEKRKRFLKRDMGMGEIYMIWIKITAIMRK